MEVEGRWKLAQVVEIDCPYFLTFGVVLFKYTNFMGVILKKSFFLLTFLVLVSGSCYVGYSMAYKDLIFPKVTVGGVEVGGLSRDVALSYLLKKESAEPGRVVYFSGSNQVEDINELAVKKDFEWAVDQAVSIGRGRNLLANVIERIKGLKSTREIEIPISYDTDDLDEIVNQIASTVEILPAWPKLLEVNNEIVFKEGKDGVQLVREKMRDQVKKAYSSFGEQKVTIPTVSISTKIKDEDFKKIMASVQAWEDGEVLLKYKDFNKTLIKREALKLVGLTGEGINIEEYEILAEEIAKAIETESKDAVFVFENGKVQEFQPEVVGVKLDKNAFQKVLTETLLLPRDRVVEIPVLLEQPKIKAGDINNMGIKELIGVGTSSFSHSIPGRVFNVNLAASRVNGVVVPPGEEFSFNKSVGQISRTTGYQTAYIISEGKTVLGDGGGVCQVSTTVFRAALNAGFPITERKAHAYRVGYYEQDSDPGIDATIFSPSTDFKFMNDTGHHILVQTKVDTKNMKMRVEIYGTSDRRVAKIGKPVMSSQSPAPATVYVDDPTLPTGTTKQIDWSAPGAKVSFDYKVERSGEVLFEKTFFSNYQPWRAVFLRGTLQ